LLRVVSFSILLLVSLTIWGVASPAYSRDALGASVVAASSPLPPEPTASVSARTGLPAAATLPSDVADVSEPARLALQGIAFLACGLLWPKKTRQTLPDGSQG
jgi:hypothetical protein